MNKLRLFLIRLLAGRDLSVMINCHIDDKMLCLDGPGLVTNCIFTSTPEFEGADDGPDVADLLYSEYAKTRGIGG